MNAKAVIVIGFLLAVGAIFFFQWKNKQQTGPSGSLQSGASVKGSKDAVEISFLYSTEKKEWIEASTSAFTKEHPDISVKLLGKGSLDAAQALVDGKEKAYPVEPCGLAGAQSGRGRLRDENRSSVVCAGGFRGCSAGAGDYPLGVRRLGRSSSSPSQGGQGADQLEVAARCGVIEPGLVRDRRQSRLGLR